MSSRAPHHARALSSLPAPERQGAPAVILAGGRGTRMSPFTSVLPKPLMPIDERSVLEIVIEQLAKCGFRDIVISIGYLGHLIEAILGDGSTRDVSIEYAREEEALGTAGPLRKVPRLDGTFLAMNGDVLTNIDHADLVHHHRRAGNTMTIATHQRIARIDYGVLSVGDGQAGVHPVEGYEEKPEIPSVVSMGVYALEPRALDFIPEDGPFDVPDLVRTLLAANEPVGAYMFDGFWLDVGRPEDWQQAVALFGGGAADGATAPRHLRVAGDGRA